MISKKNLLKRSSLCVILDRDVLGPDGLIRAAKAAARGGADIIQLRDKKSSSFEAIKIANRLKAITRRHNIPLLINDRLDVAAAARADGLHVGQGDIGPFLARRMLGKDGILGVSVKNVKEAARAKGEGADYLGAGPVFKTPMKKSKKILSLAALGRIRKIGIPVFAIGGIGLENVGVLTANGFKKIAVIRAVCMARDPFRATRQLKARLV